MSGLILPNSEPPVIPFDAHRALRNVPSFYDHEVVIDLVEYPDERHVGIRCYQGQLARMTEESKRHLFERMVLMLKILRGYNVSASLEKVEGNPPNERKG